MNKSQFYLSQCAEAAAKSPMCFTLGAVMVKGGKIISAGYNHHRTHYDGAEVGTRGHRKPVSMHAEMHVIFNLTGMSPSFKAQVQGIERRVTRRKQPQHRTKGSNGLFGPVGRPTYHHVARETNEYQGQTMLSTLAKTETMSFIGQQWECGAGFQRL